VNTCALRTILSGTIAQCSNLEHEFHHTASKLCILGFEPFKASLIAELCGFRIRHCQGDMWIRTASDCRARSRASCRLSTSSLLFDRAILFMTVSPVGWYRHAMRRRIVVTHYDDPFAIGQTSNVMRRSHNAPNLMLICKGLTLSDKKQRVAL